MPALAKTSQSLNASDRVLCAGTVANMTFAERLAAATAGKFTAISLFASDYQQARQSEKLSDADMCHMLADTFAELHEMADKIGINRKWFQATASTPHYDICKAKRELAVGHGAIECDRRQIVGVIRRLRDTRGL